MFANGSEGEVNKGDIHIVISGTHNIEEGSLTLAGHGNFHSGGFNYKGESFASSSFTNDDVTTLSATGIHMMEGNVTYDFY